MMLGDLGARVVFDRGIDVRSDPDGHRRIWWRGAAAEYPRWPSDAAATPR
jgi:hypothetical protein